MFENNESFLSTDVCPLVDELKRLKNHHLKRLITMKSFLRLRCICIFIAL